MAEINKILLNDFEQFEEEGYNVFGIFVQGSQNYLLDDDNSDIDRKVIVIPKLQDLINSIEISTERVLDSGEHIDIKDIRVLIKNWKKQALPYLELLYSKYFIINPKYKDFWNFLQNYKTDIVNYNKYFLLNNIKGLVYSLVVNGIKTSKAKKFAHIKYLEYFYKNYMAGSDFSSCLQVLDLGKREELKRLKRQDESFVQNNYRELRQDAFDFVERIDQQLKQISKANNDFLTEIFNSFLKRLFSFTIKNEFSLEGLNE